MDKCGVDICVVSLTCPNVFWGGPEVSLKAARIMNDDMTAAQTAHPDRLRWFASLPWQYPERALAELDRAHAAGASGVMVLANVDGRSLTDPAFAPIWAAIDAKALPVLVHPTAPPGVADMDMERFQLTASLGFTFDTSLAVARMIYDGFFDRYRKLKIIAAHGGGALPYLIARMDQCFDNIPACREKISVRPSEYMSRIYADAVVFAPDALALCVQAVRRRQRDVRLRLSAYDRRHARVSRARERLAGERARPGARLERAADIRVLVRDVESRHDCPTAVSSAPRATSPLTSADRPRMSSRSASRRRRFHGSRSTPRSSDALDAVDAVRRSCSS